MSPSCSTVHLRVGRMIYTMHSTSLYFNHVFRSYWLESELWLNGTEVSILKTFNWWFGFQFGWCGVCTCWWNGWNWGPPLTRNWPRWHRKSTCFSISSPSTLHNYSQHLYHSFAKLHKSLLHFTESRFSFFRPIIAVQFVVSKSLHPGSITTLRFALLLRIP